MSTQNTGGFSIDHHKSQRLGIEPIPDLKEFLRNEFVVNQIETIKEFEEAGFLRGDPESMRRMEEQIDKLNSILTPNKNGGQGEKI